ncbi:MAG TPA: hypothetical protein DCM49_02420 [Lachnospiraceae bacterium]|nr:hypothetical protein [Lachnospiraceae bacterium]
MKKTEVKTYELDISNRNLPPGSLNILFITDLHGTCREKDAVRKILKDISGIRPDVILIGGDLIVRRYPDTFAKSAAFAAKLTSFAPVYYTYGNHEKKCGNPLFRKYTEKLQSYGISFLLNRNVRIMINGVPVRIFGYDLDLPYYQKIRHQDLPVSDIYEKLGKPDDRCINILLAHHPRFHEQYIQWGADLTLCGHYHGGVMRLGGNRGLISPDFRLFPDDSYGEIENNGKHVIISSGAGEHTVPFRIFNPREIVQVRINVRDDTSCRRQDVQQDFNI